MTECKYCKMHSIKTELSEGELSAHIETVHQPFTTFGKEVYRMVFKK